MRKRRLCGPGAPIAGRRAAVLGAGLSAAAVLAAGGAAAAPPPLSAPTTAESPTGGPTGSTGFLSSLKRTNFLLGDLFGLRTALSRYGISLAIQETSEVLGNATGGVRRGADYDGLTQAILQLNTQRAFGWYGGLLNVSALEVHGRNLSTDALRTVQTASGIEADRGVRLWELWYDQKFLPEDRASIRIGQQSLDQEFIVSPNAGYFVNTMFGWPAVPSYDLPGGGPAYPLSALGVRVKWRPLDPLTILGGVWNGGPAPPGNCDPQALNPSGLSFPTRGGALAFVELQWTYPALGSMVYPGAGAPLGHTWKVGAWWDGERFADQKLDAAGLPLVSPASTGVPASHRGDYSLYAVADQMVWRQDKDPNRSVSVFARVMGAPQADRNLLSFSANAGITYHDPLANRPDDTLAVGVGYARFSPAVTTSDEIAAALARGADPAAFVPVRRQETFVEATYQWQVRPWWQVQPDVQYVISPGGGVINPASPNQTLANELVMGVRTNVLF